MSGRKFIDTNVFVYALDPAAPPKKLKSARALIRSAIADRDGVVSYQVIQELVNVALRKFTVPVAPADLGDFIDGSFRRMLIVHSSLELFHAALSIQTRYRLAWYDSIIVAAAVESGCASLYSEDLQDGARYGGVQVANPFR
jgi:predicted nucleic acid-binding protein